MLKTVSTLDIPAVRFGEREAIRMLAKAGFDGCDWSMFSYSRPDGFFNRPDWRLEARELKKIADENGVPFLQAHAPFPSNDARDETKTAEIRKYLLLSLEACSLVECPYVIIHPVDTFPASSDPMMRETAYRMNVEFYGSLIPRAKELGVRICLENMFGHNDRYNRIVPSRFSTAEEMARCIDELDGGIDACLDVGHAVLVNDTMDHMARVLGSRLKTLHVHSNDGINDRHTAPLVFRMDWESFGKALYDIGFDGAITLEADNFLVPLPDDMIALGLDFLAANARYVASLVKA